ncbi:MAG: 50S ribosomal protein L18 [Pyrinomonadaceae bacterium]
MAQRDRAGIRRAVHGRIRKKVSGTEQRPRLAIFRSVSHIYAQVIDDVNGKTLASASTVEKDLKGAAGGNIAAAKIVGKAIAERALAAGISNVVYDRGGYVYHGRVKALFDATREAGLNKGEQPQAEETKEESNEKK